MYHAIIYKGLESRILISTGRMGANFDFFFDFFCDLLVIQQRVVQPPYVGMFNSFSPVIEI